VGIERAFEQLEADADVGFEIYRRRQLTDDKPPTLQLIATERGVSRERIRQLERQFEKRLNAEVIDRPESPIAIAAYRLAEQLGPLFRRTAVDSAIVAVVADPEPVLRERHRVVLLLNLAGPYEHDREWLCRQGLREEATAVLARLTAETPSVSPASVAEELSAACVPADDFVAWLEGVAGYRVIGEQVVPWGRSLADKGVAILALRGRPMTLEEIFGELGERRSIRSFKNQMQGDPRVRRRGLKHYGLLVWGGEEYTSVVDEMMQEIERQGGRVDLEELAGGLAESFGISPASVRMYATGPQFDVDEAGVVSVSLNPRVVPETKPLALTRSCFRLPTGWAYRRTVDHDVLRGSGSSIPLGFAKELGLIPGETKRLRSPHGRLHCAWRSHVAQLGSLRPIALAVGASEGDYLFLIAEGDDEVGVRFVPASDCETVAGLGRLGLECGARDPSYTAIAEAVGADNRAAGSPAIRIRQWFLQRGERDLAALVPTDDEDDLLDVLAEL
jgi:xanthosine utilization system XapX-like protein